MRNDIIASIFLAVTVALLFLEAPIHADPVWSDAPRHALNGVFVKDFIAAMPLDDPWGFASRYYLQYPALTLLFYPPVFYVISAPFFAVFGVSYETALFVVFIHYVALAVGSYWLARFWLPFFFALAAALLIAVSPEIAFWGRQIMLDIPALMFVVWSAVSFTTYRRTGKIYFLYLCAALLVLATYTKINAGFLCLVYSAAELYERRTALFRDKNTYIISALVALGLVPLILLSMEFGQANIQAVLGNPDPEISRLSLSSWLWYLRKIPQQVGWPTTVLAAIGVLIAIAKPDRLGLERSSMRFLGLWFGLGYLFYSLIELRETRHSIFILPPVVILAVTAVRALLTAPAARLATVALVVVTGAETIYFRPLLYVQGYASAVEFVAKAAPRNSVVLFSGYRDGAFIFSMRAREDRRDLSVLRADKLLLTVAVKRELGISEKQLSEKNISNIINRFGVSYVVIQPGFWTDLEIMRRFEALLRSSQFEEVARIPISGNFPVQDKELVVYRNLGPIVPGPVELEIEIPMINQKIKGIIGQPQSDR